LLCSRASLLCVSLPCLALPLPCLALPAAVALVRSRQLPTVFVRTYSQHEPIFSELPHDEERKQRHLPQCIPCLKHPPRSAAVVRRTQAQTTAQTNGRETDPTAAINSLPARSSQRAGARRPRSAAPNTRRRCSTAACQGAFASTGATTRDRAAFRLRRLKAARCAALRSGCVAAALLLGAQLEQGRFRYYFNIEGTRGYWWVLMGTPRRRRLRSRTRWPSPAPARSARAGSGRSEGGASTATQPG
jgi:hypothetical protein